MMTSVRRRGSPIQPRFQHPSQAAAVVAKHLTCCLAAMEGANALAEVLLLAIAFTGVCAMLGWHSRRYS
jgi:hypothetical protein